MSRTRRPASTHFLRKHSLSLTLAGILVFLFLMYRRSDLSTHVGAFFGNALADWLAVFILVLEVPDRIPVQHATRFHRDVVQQTGRAGSARDLDGAWGVRFIVSTEVAAINLYKEGGHLMHIKQRIAPCLWFDHHAEEAAAFYVSVFKNSKITSVARYPKAGQETHKQRPGSVMTVAFELDGQAFTALNGGPVFKFNEAVSLQVNCDNQEQVDYYWDKLSKGGDPKAQQCGWLKDKYGLSWQVVPTVLPKLLSDHDSPTAERAMEAMLRMKKIDIAELERAVAGEPVAS